VILAFGFHMAEPIFGNSSGRKIPVLVPISEAEFGPKSPFFFAETVYLGCKRTCRAARSAEKRLTCPCAKWKA